MPRTRDYVFGCLGWAVLLACLGGWAAKGFASTGPVQEWMDAHGLTRPFITFASAFVGTSFLAFAYMVWKDRRFRRRLAADNARLLAADAPSPEPPAPRRACP